jgi:hypothetical protein
MLENLNILNVDALYRDYTDLKKQLDMPAFCSSATVLV